MYVYIYTHTPIISQKQISYHMCPPTRLHSDAHTHTRTHTHTHTPVRPNASLTKFLPNQFLSTCVPPRQLHSVYVCMFICVYMNVCMFMCMYVYVHTQDLFTQILTTCVPPGQLHSVHRAEKHYNRLDRTTSSPVSTLFRERGGPGRDKSGHKDKSGHNVAYHQLPGPSVDA